MASKADLEQAGAPSFTGAQADLFAQGFSFSGYERNVVQLHLGGDTAGGRFMNISGISGLDAVTDGRAAVFADFDNDGDADVFVAGIQGDAHQLFRNQIGNEAGWLRVELRGADGGTDACGAVVRVRTSTGTLTKVKACGSGYLSQGDARLLFGLGDDPRAEELTITWPSGREQRFGPVPARTAIRLVEGEEEWIRVDERSTSLPEPLDPEQALAERLTIAPGDPLPDLAIRTLDGEASTLHAQLSPGRRTLINLWATYCVPCRREMPEISRRVADYDRRGIDVLGLSLDRIEARLVRDYLLRLDILYPSVLVDDDVAAAIYGSNEVFIPLTLLVGADGRILEIFAGGSRQATRRIVALARPE